MKTLHEIFESGGQSSAPYNTALKVVVCGIGQVVQYRNASGDQRESVTVGFADQSMAAKGTLYDMTKKDTLRVGSTVMLMNSIIKNDMKTIVITNKSKVLKTSPLEDVPIEREFKKAMLWHVLLLPRQLRSRQSTHPQLRLS